jgi:ABC-type multidrug transport system ATPase subunit
MQISVTGLGKKYQREWIFRNLDQDFDSGSSYAITGPNGSGKSTLLQLMTGYFPPTEGTVQYSVDGQTIPVDKQYRYLDVITPYLEIIEEFTLREFLSFHFKFKELKEGYSLDTFVDKVYLQQDLDKMIRNFSSGMKQRLKLGLAFFSQCQICFLDEPTSNLDQKGVDWYLKNIKEVVKQKLVVISSNQIHEYDFCENVIHIPHFK